MRKKNIDIFLQIIDNLGDMGFVVEFLYFFQKNFPKNYNFTIYTNHPEILKSFFEVNKLQNFVSIYDEKNWRSMAKLAISFFHSPLPYQKYEKIFRVDYISLDDMWLQNNFGEYIFSTPKNKILELIPSPKNEGFGILPKIENIQNRQNFVKKFNIGDISKKWLSCFCYKDSLCKINFDNIPQYVEVFLFGAKNFSHPNIGKNIFLMPLLHFTEFYNFLENSDYIITRGEVSFSQVLQM